MVGHLPDGSEYLHDCDLERMVYEPDAPSGRTLSLTLTCPHDLGYEPWNGKRIVLRATDVHAMQLFTWPVGGGETVTGVHPHISERMREDLLRSTT